MGDVELDFQPAEIPSDKVLEGRFIRLEKLKLEKHTEGLFLALQGPDSDPGLWDYVPWGPFPKQADFDKWLTSQSSCIDSSVYCVIDKSTDSIKGTLNLMSIVPAHGRIEIGGVLFGAGMQRTPQSTEAIYLLAKEAFESGYRRLEWKSNTDNLRSRRTAERFGFQLEGVFRQHKVLKGCNRDTAWYSVLDSGWPVLKTALEGWLSAGNFDEDGVQIKTLEAFRLGEY